MQTPVFSKKSLIFKNSKSLLHKLKLSVMSLEIYHKPNKHYIFMIRKDLSFCDHNLQFVAILHKKLKILVFFFFSFNSCFFQNVITTRKINAMNKKSYFSLSKATKEATLF